MTEQQERSTSNAVDWLIESRRRGEADASAPEQPSEASDLAALASSLEDRWQALPSVNEDLIWRRVNVGMRSMPQSPPSRWSRFLSALTPRSLPASLTAGGSARVPALVAGALAIVLVVVATFATQRQSGYATFVTDVDNLARFTAAVLNDRQLSPRERGEVERRASGLLSAVQANPSVLAELDRSDAELVVSRIDGILTLLEPYENDQHGGVDTSIVPLSSVRQQVESAQSPTGSPREAFAPATTPPTPSAPSTTAVASTPTSTSESQQRGAAQPRRTPNATATAVAFATPGARALPSVAPPLDREALRDLCGNERGSRQGRCRAAMAQLESACQGDSSSERCEDALADALERCRDLRDEETATECQRALLALTAGLASGSDRHDQGENRRPSRNNDDDDGNNNPNAAGSNADGQSDDDSRRSGDDGDRRGGRPGDEELDDRPDDDDDDRADRGRWFRRGRGGGSSR